MLLFILTKNSRPTLLTDQLLYDITMRKKTKTELLAKALSSEKRVKILFVIDAHGPLRFSELKEKLSIKSSGELNYHLTLLKEVNMVDLDYSYGQRRYTLTPLGKETVELLKRLEGELLKQELGIYIIDKYGLAVKYDTSILIDVLKDEFDIRGKHIRTVRADVEQILSELDKAYYEKWELDQIILSVLLKNNLMNYFMKNTFVGFRKKELDRILNKKTSFTNTNEEIRNQVIAFYNLLYKIPGNVKTLIRNGIFYISHLHEWTLKSEAIILDTPYVMKGYHPLDLYNLLLFTKKLAHSLFLRKFNKILYDTSIRQRKFQIEEFLAKNFRTLNLIWDDLKYEKIAVEILIEDDSELVEFDRILLRQILLEEYQGPPIVLNIKSKKAFRELYDVVYDLARKHIPITLVNNTAKYNFIAAISHILREENCKDITIIDSSYNLLLPSLAVFSRRDKAIAEDFLNNTLSCLDNLINKKREYLRENVLLRKLQKISGNLASIDSTNVLSILGGEMATHVLLADLDNKKSSTSVIRILKNLVDRFRDLEKIGEKSNICYSTSEINLYEINFRALTYRAKEFNIQLPPFEEFNLLSPFSKTPQSLRERVMNATQLFRETKIPDIFTLEFTDPFPALENFSELLKKLLNLDVKVISLSYDYTQCEYCGHKTSRYTDICPNCLSVKPYVVHYGKIIIDYRPLNHIPKIAKEEYLRRNRINDINLRKELPSI